MNKLNELMNKLVDKIKTPFKFKVLVSVMMTILIMFGQWVFWPESEFLRAEVEEHQAHEIQGTREIQQVEETEAAEDAEPFSFHFRSTQWGMTIDEVKALEGEPDIEFFYGLVYIKSDKALYGLGIDIESFNLPKPAAIFYLFTINNAVHMPRNDDEIMPDGRRIVDGIEAVSALSLVQYQIRYPFFYFPIGEHMEGFYLGSERMIADYEELRAALIKKHGEPDMPDDFFRNRFEKVERPSEDDFRPSTMEPHFTLSTSWTRGGTTLVLQLSKEHHLTVTMLNGRASRLPIFELQLPDRF